MTDLNLKELDALEKAATTGGWHWSEKALYLLLRFGHKNSGGWDEVDEDDALAILPQTPEDAKFIVAARNSMRPLLTLVEKQHKQLEAGEWLPECPYCGGAFKSEGHGLDCQYGAALAAYKEAQGGEMNERDTQHNQVLQMLDEAEAICSTTFLRHYIPRAGARIWDLRQEGCVIETRRCRRPGHKHRTRQVEYALQKQPRQMALQEGR